MGVILHFQSTGTVPGQGEPAAMIGASLTIGRGPENDLCLPDPGKVISKNHCAIEAQDGRVVVIDLSTNGTFLNYGNDPLGPVPTPLNDGDILTVGSYELMVQITQEPMAPRVDPVAMPALAPDDGFGDLLSADDGGDFLDDLLGPDTAPVGPSSVTRPDLGDDGLLPPLGEEEELLPPEADPAAAAWSEAGVGDHGDAAHDAFVPQTPAAASIPEDWEDDLLLPGAPPSPVPEGDPFAPGPIAPEPLEPRSEITVPPGGEATPPDPQPEVADPIPTDTMQPGRKTVPPPDTSPSPATATTDSATRAFLAALGADQASIPDDALDETMAQLGSVMATMIRGMREILMTRASIKSEFRIQQTVIGAGDNNPLKFSVSPEQAIAAMVRPAAGYLPPVKAAEQALGDIKAHEVAMMTAMEAALKGVLQQLSPEQLETQLTTSGGISGLLKGKKARYWDIYETMYSRISDQAETDFHDLFGRAFARAYQDQMERLK